MQPLGAAQIRGNWATLLLPINPDDSIEHAHLEAEIDYLIDAQVDGIYSNGSAGEFYSQSENEFDQVNQALAERCERARMPFQIGASHASPQVSLDRVARAAALKPSAIQVILPDWFPSTDQEALNALQGYARAAGEVGLVLYNPPHAKRVLSPETLATLAQNMPNLVGIKVADGDQGWYERMRPGSATSLGVCARSSFGDWGTVRHRKRCLLQRGVPQPKRSTALVATNAQRFARRPRVGKPYSGFYGSTHRAVQSRASECGS